MNRIMHRSIHQVSKYKTREKHESKPVHQNIHQQKQNGGDDDTWHGGHEQPFFITRKMMMISMHHINYLLGAWAFSDHVKNPTVHNVFEKRPKETTGKKN